MNQNKKKDIISISIDIPEHSYNFFEETYLRSMYKLNADVTKKLMLGEFSSFSIIYDVEFILNSDSAISYQELDRSGSILERFNRMRDFREIHFIKMTIRAYVEFSNHIINKREEWLK